VNIKEIFFSYLRSYVDSVEIPKDGCVCFLLLHHHYHTFLHFASRLNEQRNAQDYF